MEYSCAELEPCALLCYGLHIGHPAILYSMTTHFDAPALDTVTL